MHTVCDSSHAIRTLIPSPPMAAPALSCLFMPPSSRFRGRCRLSSVVVILRDTLPALVFFGFHRLVHSPLMACLPTLCATLSTVLFARAVLLKTPNGSSHPAYPFPAFSSWPDAQIRPFHRRAQRNFCFRSSRAFSSRSTPTSRTSASSSGLASRSSRTTRQR